jgi:hypothetical protein
VSEDGTVSFETWDIVLLAMAGYVAVVSLVRLMQRRQDELIAELTVEAQQAKKSRSKEGSSERGAA